MGDDFDLATGWAVPLRAYLESFLINGYMNNLDGGYPGFQRAAPEAVERGSHEWSELPNSVKRLRGSVEFGDEHLRVIGNEDLHVLRVEPLAHGFRAFVCDATFNVYKQAGDSKQVLPLYLASSAATNADFHNMRVWRTEFSNQGFLAGGADAPTVPQRGPLPAPQADVFGPWYVTGSERVSLWSDHDHPDVKPGSPEAEQYFHDAQTREDGMREECLIHYPLNAAERTKRATTVLDGLPTVQPAIPGWPDEG
ncbi:hypothetical protein [Mycobacterium aquaticum]|uniref:hypothetical protein n=1 Tax=Mycobacterium aquaticum TaxID=1927124 RepID=UPI00114EBAA6|nr:hypothetical protein [Mycobacterium aquaticum]